MPVCVPNLLCTFVLLSSLAFAHERPERESMVPEPTAAGASDVPDRVLLSWKNDPATSFSVTWRSLKSPDAAAEIAIATDGPEFTHEAKLFKAETKPLKTDVGVVHMHAVTFTGLKPNTKYVYRVGSRRTVPLEDPKKVWDLTQDYSWSEWFSCRTAKSFEGKVEPVRFVYVGDAQNDLKSHWSRLIREAYSDAPDMTFMLHAGDLVNRGNNDHEWGQWFHSLGWISGTVPQIAIPGNHEYDRDQFADVKPGERISRTLARRWPLRFELPENGPKGTTENVFFVDVQGVRLIGLDSNRDDLQQAEWLRKVLKNNPNRWTIVTHHHPIYSAGGGRDNPDLRNKLQPIYDEFGVDLVLQGHDHTYGRSEQMHYGDVDAPELNNKAGLQVHDPDGGPIYVVSVSGPKMYNKKSYAPGSDPFVKHASGKQLYQVITVEHDRLTFQASTATGELFDSFVLTKNAEGKNRLVKKKSAEAAPVETPVSSK